MKPPIQIERIQDVTIAISEDIQERKEVALITSGFITEVNDDDSQNSAISAIRELKDIASQVEKARQSCKKPFLEKGRELDAIAKAFSESLITEQKRIHGVMTVYTVEQNRIRQEAERKRHEEIRKAEEEKQKALEAVRDAERKRLAEIAKAEEEKRRAEQAVIDAKNDVERKTAEIERQQAIIAQKEAQENQESKIAATIAEETIKEAKQTALDLPKPEKTKGVQVRKELRVELVDIAKLYAARPDLCELTAKLSLIKQTIKGGESSIPGVKHWIEETPIVR